MQRDMKENIQFSIRYIKGLKHMANICSYFVAMDAAILEWCHMVLNKYKIKALFFRHVPNHNSVVNTSSVHNQLANQIAKRLVFEWAILLNN